MNATRTLAALPAITLALALGALPGQAMADRDGDYRQAHWRHSGHDRGWHGHPKGHYKPKHHQHHHHYYEHTHTYYAPPRYYSYYPRPVDGGYRDNGITIIYRGSW
jgi:hypothetical protein